MESSTEIILEEYNNLSQNHKDMMIIFTIICMITDSSDMYEKEKLFKLREQQYKKDVGYDGYGKPWSDMGDMYFDKFAFQNSRSLPKKDALNSKGKIIVNFIKSQILL